MVNVDIDQQLKAWAEDAAELVTPIGAAEAVARAEVQDNDRPVDDGQGRWQRRAVALIAAAAATIALVVWLAPGGDAVRDRVVADDGDAPAQPATEESTSPLDPDVDELRERWAHGWTDVDTGPLSPRQGAALVAAGREVLVLGGERHHDGAAFDLVDGTWRMISEPPLPDGVPQVAWTGSEVLAIVSPPGENRRAAAWNPATDRWRPVNPPPPIRFDGPGNTQQPALFAVGGQVVLPDAWAAWDPGTNEWNSLPDIPGTVGTYTALAADRTRIWVLTAEEGSHRLDLTTGTWTSWPGPPIHAAGGYTDAAVVADSVVYFADEAGDVQQLPFGDGPSAEWRITTRHADVPNCTPQVLVVDGQPFVDICVAQQWFTPAAEWVDATGGVESCCYDDLVSAGPVLFQWISNDDTANDASAPRARARVWRPPAGEHPPTAFDEKGQPVEPRSPDDARRIEAAVADRFPGDLSESFDEGPPKIGDPCATNTRPIGTDLPLVPVAGGDSTSCVVAGFAYRDDVVRDVLAFDEWGFAAVPIFDGSGRVIDFFDRGHQPGLAWTPPD